MVLGKNHKTTSFNQHDKSHSCCKLLKACKKNQLIKYHVNCKNLNEAVINLLNVIANHLILETSTIIGELNSIHQMSSTESRIFHAYYIL